jgi:ribosome modulation factor
VIERSSLRGLVMSSYAIAYENGWEAGYAGKARVVPLDFERNEDGELHSEWLVGYDQGKKDKEIGAV